MRKRIVYVVGGVVCCAVLAVTLIFQDLGAMTADDVQVIREGDKEMMVRFKGEEGLLYKQFNFTFDTPFRDWFGTGKWTTMNLLSPSATDVDAYVKLRRSIFDGSGDFKDNRIEATGSAARFSAVAPTGKMFTTKSMVENNDLWFVKGDHLWFKGRFLLESGVPFTIVDFQERGRKQSPGPRITIWERSHIGIELKYRPKPQLRQLVKPVPIGKWFDLKVHLVLDDESGEVQIWQDDELIIDGQMQTLARANSLLNALEVGITATGEAATVLVSEVEISHNPL